MFWQFFGFELKFWLRSWMLWIFLLIIAALIFGAVSTDKVRVGGALEHTYRNAPFVIENYYAIIGILTVLMTTAFVNSAAARDFFYRTHEIVFSTPVRKSDYLLGRYAGSALIAVIPMTGVSLAILLAKYMRWNDPERWGPIHCMAHLDSLIAFAIPNTLFVAAVIFAIASLARCTVTSFIARARSPGWVRHFAAADVGHEERNGRHVARPVRHRHIRASHEVLDRFGQEPSGARTDGHVAMDRLLWMTVSAVVFALLIPVSVSPTWNGDDARCRRRNRTL